MMINLNSIVIINRQQKGLVILHNQVYLESSKEPNGMPGNFLNNKY